MWKIVSNYMPAHKPDTMQSYIIKVWTHYLSDPDCTVRFHETLLWATGNHLLK